MADAESYIVGIDLGGTKILSLCLDGAFGVVGRDLRDTDAERGPDAVIESMAASARAAAGGRPLRAVGISTAGPADVGRGVVTTPPNLPGWRDVPLAALIEERMGVPVWMENDANAAALAEHRFGAGRYTRHMILLTLGTGVGGGLIIDGRLYHGASGAAGELGHIRLVENGPLCGCGQRGCLEALASGRAMGERAKEIATREPEGILARIAAEGGEIDAKLLEQAADAGDRSAEAAIREAGRQLGAGMRSIVNVFNPEMIVVGGSLRKLGERYLGVGVDVMREEAFPQAVADVRVVEAELGDEAPALGAALIAYERSAES